MIGPLEKSWFINMRGAVARRARFLQNVAEVDWPAELPIPERWPGVDESPPAWYVARRQDWSCMRAHLNLLEHCLLQGITRILVFEDDCLFSPDFADRYRRFAAAVPENWNGFYLGGNHTLLPEPVNDEVLLCRRTNMTISYGLRDDSLAAPFYVLGRFAEQLKTQPVHIDTLWATLHEHRVMKTYAPWNWITGQAANISDRTGAVWQEQWFHLSQSLKEKLRGELHVRQTAVS